MALADASGPSGQSRAHLRIVKISRMKCLVGWHSVNQSKSQVTVDVVQKFYFLMFTGINILLFVFVDNRIITYYK